MSTQATSPSLGGFRESDWIRFFQTPDERNRVYWCRIPLCQAKGVAILWNKRFTWKTFFIILLITIMLLMSYIVFGKVLPYYQAQAAAKTFLTAFDGKSLREGLNTVQPFLRANGDFVNFTNSLPPAIRNAFDQKPVERVTDLKFTNGIVGSVIASYALQQTLQQDGYGKHNLVVLPFKMTIELPLTHGNATYDGTITMVYDGGWKVGHVDGVVEATIGNDNFMYVLPGNAIQPYTNSHYMAPLDSFKDYMFPVTSSVAAYFTKKVLARHSFDGNPQPQNPFQSPTSNGTMKDEGETTRQIDLPLGDQQTRDQKTSVLPSDKHSLYDFTPIRTRLAALGYEYDPPKDGVETFTKNLGGGFLVQSSHVLEGGNIGYCNCFVSIEGNHDPEKMKELAKQITTAVLPDTPSATMNEITSFFDGNGRDIKIIHLPGKWDIHLWRHRQMNVDFTLIIDGYYPSGGWEGAD